VPLATLKNNKCSYSLNPEFDSGGFYWPFGRLQGFGLIMRVGHFARQNRYQPRIYQRCEIPGKFSHHRFTRDYLAPIVPLHSKKQPQMLLNPELNSGLLLALPLAKGSANQKKKVLF